METIMGIINWFQANMVNISTIIAYVISAASIIVKMTPGIKDDEFLLKVVKFLGKYIALNVSRDDKLKEIK